MRPDRDPDWERPDLFSDALGDDPTLRRMVDDLDTLYSQPQVPARLLLPQEWATAATRQAADPRECDAARRVAEPPDAPRRSMRGAPMFTRERSIRPRRMQVLAATAAAMVIVGLLSILLARGTPTKRSPAGSNTSATGDAAVLQQFAQQGGASLVVTYACPANAYQCDAEKTLPLLETKIKQRLADADIATSVFFEPQGNSTLAIKVPGVKDDSELLALLAHGRVWFLGGGSEQTPIGSDVTGKTCATTSACQPGQLLLVASGLDVDPASVSAGLDPQTNQPVVTFAFNSSARQQFANFTRQNVGQYLTITLDEKVIESAIIQSEIDGSGQITGLASTKQAQELAVYLRDGSLPLDVSAQYHHIDGPTGCGPGSGLGSAPSAFGTPAITPHIAHPAAGQPAYTVSDVRAYVEAHLPGRRASILQIYQLTALQADALDYCAPVPNDNPVFVVTLTGDFPTESGPQGPVGHFWVEIFDGLTGNQIAPIL